MKCLDILLAYADGDYISIHRPAVDGHNGHRIGMLDAGLEGLDVASSSGVAGLLEYVNLS